MADIETTETKLEKVFRKAIEQGWQQQLLEDQWRIHPSGFDGRFEFCVPRPVEESVSHIDVEAVLFDHGFADALWGHSDTARFEPNCVYHLREMVLSHDRIKYALEHYNDR